MPRINRDGQANKHSDNMKTGRDTQRRASILVCVSYLHPQYFPNQGGTLNTFSINMFYCLSKEKSEEHNIFLSGTVGVLL